MLLVTKMDTDTPPLVPVEERAIVPWTKIVPAQAPMPDLPRIARPKAKVRYNPNAPHLARAPRLESREKAIDTLHRMRTNVALPLPLEAFLGNVGDGVHHSTPLVFMEATSSAGDPDFSEAPIAFPARGARNPAPLDTPYTNAAHMPPDATLSPSLDGD